MKEVRSGKKYDTKLYCIREKRSDKILGVSFSPEGLSFIANKTGRILLYKNARFVVKNDRLSVVGDTREDDRLYVTEYNKINHLEKYTEMKDSDRYDQKTLDTFYKRAVMMNSYEHFWEKSIEMKMEYYNYFRA